MLIPNFIMFWPNFDFKPPDFEDLAFEDEKLFELGIFFDRSN